MKPLVLTLPLPAPRNTSADRHWARRHRRVQAYYERCDFTVLSNRIALPETPWPAVWASAVIYPRGANDQDNLLARLKPMVDWCVRAGIVEDDRPRSWRWENIPAQHVQRREDAHVVLSLTPCLSYHEPERVG